MIFTNTVLRGREASPFDDGHWIPVSTPRAYGADAVTERIRHQSQILLVRLPRFIDLLRRYQAADKSSTQEKIAPLVCELWAVRNEQLERASLEAVRMVDTRDPALVAYFKQSYTFRDLSLYHALVLLWTARMMLVRLSRVYLSLYGNGETHSDGPAFVSEQNLNQAQAELCDHIFMSINYTAALPPISHWAFLLAAPPLYGALGERTYAADTERGTALRTIPVTTISSLLQQLQCPRSGAEVMLHYLSTVCNSEPLPGV